MMRNNFLTAVGRKNTQTENGAISNSSTGNQTLDYFAKVGTYRNRELKEVFADLSAMWQEDRKQAMKIVFYNRIVSRKTKGFVTTDSLQSGQGNKDEFRKSIIWLARYHPAILGKNLWIIPLVGSWKDLWHTDLIDELDVGAVYGLIERGIACEYNRDLVAKYLPRIRSKSNVYNERHEKLNRYAYGLMKYLKWNPAQYRKFKSSGRAHDFQKKMSLNQFADIDFKSIPGRALHHIVNKKGRDSLTVLERHGINGIYLEWIHSQPVVKFTGYVYELLSVVNTQMSLAQMYTVNKQFDGLIAKAKELGTISENVWCALDTSGSMTARVADTSAFDICLSLGIYFSTLNTGSFKDHVMMFSDRSRVKTLYGEFCDKVLQLKSDEIAWGSTNYQSVIDEIVRVRMTSPEIPLEDYPSTLLVVSDMQFDIAGDNVKTNYEAAMEKLASVGLPKVKIVWWWVTGRGSDFPSTLDDDVVMMSGFDGSILSLLLGEEVKEVKELSNVTKQETGPLAAMNKVLSQEVLDLVQV